MTDSDAEAVQRPPGIIVDGLVKDIRQHALAHYSDGGWDVIVEATDDEEIADMLYDTPRKRQPVTLEQVLALKDCTLLTVISIWADRQADAINSAF